uniref:Reverse transcriptase Ty1/copia-type domain-containing protein n=1 Tax=Solanum lycopersicum TaxID=4081 RepID=A0A3Q7EEV0_SOLLC
MTSPLSPFNYPLWCTIANEIDCRLLAYSDSEWAGDAHDRTWTTGYVIYLGSSPISWSSMKQRLVSSSSTEAEYWAVVSTVSETDLPVFFMSFNFLLLLFQEFSVTISAPLIFVRIMFSINEFHNS